MHTRRNNFSVYATALLGVLLLALVFRHGDAPQIPFAYADATQNVSGFAWSSNIGWISFNCLDSSGASSPQQNTCAAANYGVNIDPLTGNFTGFAWSSSIGYINFNPTNDPAAGGGGCTASPCAKLDLVTKNVNGWARACDVLTAANCTGTATSSSSKLGGWDGWIKLTDPSWTNPATYDYIDGLMNGVPTTVYDSGCPGNCHHGIYLDTVTSKLKGFAWGGLVVGWIDFAPIVPPAAGGVLVTGIANGAPSAPIITGPTPVAPNVSVGPYTSSSTDPQRDQIRYLVSWGDGSALLKLPASGTVDSGTAQSSNHTFPAVGSFSVAASAIDASGNQSATSTYIVAVGVPVMVITPGAQQDFGNVSINTTAFKDFVVQNTGPVGSFLKGNAKTTDAHFTCTSGCDYYTAGGIIGGGSQTVRITFAPGPTVGTISGNYLSFGGWNTSPVATSTLLVFGNGVLPISITPPSGLDFGNVASGTTKDLVLTITNTGSTDFGSDTLTLPSGYSCTSGCTIDLTHGVVNTVTIQFFPLLVQSYDGTGSLTTNSSVTFSLKGAGVLKSFKFKDQ
jgi:hypothetical protein